MGLSPVNFFANHTSLFSQNKDNKPLSMMQNISAAYAGGAFQLRRNTVADVLELSQEGLEQSQNLPTVTVPSATDATDEVVDPTETAATDDVTLGTAKELTEQQRVELIRVNKNSVLERVKELLADKGLEVPEDQNFDLKVNFLDGSVEVTGIEDPELAQQFNDALQGDADLMARMRKTRDDLGLPEQENTVPRNFTIQFDSMQATPEDAELEYHIDLYINKEIDIDGEQEADTDTEDTTAATGTKSTDSEKTATDTSKAALTALHFSFVFTNIPKQAPSIVDLTPDLKKDDETQSKAEKEKEQLGADPLDEGKEAAA